jgi:carboxyl-terminal processing protease
MNKKISIGAAISLMALTAAVAITITAFIVMNSLNVSISNFTKRAALFQKLSDVDSIVREKYVGPIDDTQVTDYTIAGYMKGLGDKYGGYLDAQDYKNIAMSNEGQSLGIGVNVVNSADGCIKVVSIIDGSPAQKAGVKVNDEITAIGGEDVKAAGYANSVNLLKGSEGTTVAFTVLRGGISIPFSVVRQSYAIQSVQSKLIGNLGYVKIIEFDSNTDVQFSDQVDSLIKNGAKGLVFDVRNNPGGLLESAEHMIDKIVPAGPVVRAKYKDGSIKVLYTSDASQINLPMAVITNQNTASAAELFTAALKDYGKAKSVGTVTYGKGTMQEICDLGDGTALDLSVAYFYPPTSDNFEGKGVEPDIPVQLSEQKQENFYSLSEDDDDQLQAAISYVEMQIK